jgi:hypothetical protein
VAILKPAGSTSITEAGAVDGIRVGSMLGSDADCDGDAESVPEGAHAETVKATPTANKTAAIFRIKIG